jgi:hypothetical protein
MPAWIEDMLIHLTIPDRPTVVLASGCGQVSRLTGHALQWRPITRRLVQLFDVSCDAIGPT